MKTVGHPHAPTVLPTGKESAKTGVEDEWEWASGFRDEKKKSRLCKQLESSLSISQPCYSIYHIGSSVKREWQYYNMYNWLRARRSGVRIPGKDNKFYLLQNAQTVSEAHPAAQSMGNGVLSRG